MPQKPPRNYKETQRKDDQLSINIHTAQFLIYLKLEFLFHDYKS